jgi:predicted secreted protein
MATGAQAGRIGAIYQGNTTSAFTKIGEVRNWRITLTHRPIDATSNDSSGWDESIKGQQAGTLSWEALYLSGNAAQKEVRKQFSTSGSQTYRLYPSSAGTAKWTFTGWLTQFSVGGSHDQPALFNGEIQGTGSFTYTT